MVQGPWICDSEGVRSHLISGVRQLTSWVYPHFSGDVARRPLGRNRFSGGSACLSDGFVRPRRLVVSAPIQWASAQWRQTPGCGLRFSDHPRVS